MTLSDCYIRQLLFERFSVSKGLISYDGDDDFWETIFNTQSSTNTPVSKDYLEVLFIGEDIDYQGDTNDQIDILSEKKRAQQFQSDSTDSKRTILPKSPITIRSNSRTVNYTDTSNHRKKVKLRHSERYRRTNSKPIKNQVSLFWQKQRKHRFSKKPTEDDEHVIRYGLYMGSTDERYKVCPVNRRTHPHSSDLNRRCLCQSLVIRSSPLKKEITK